MYEKVTFSNYTFHIASTAQSLPTRVGIVWMFEIRSATDMKNLPKSLFVYKSCKIKWTHEEKVIQIPLYFLLVLVIAFKVRISNDLRFEVICTHQRHAYKVSLFSFHTLSLSWFKVDLTIIYNDFLWKGRYFESMSFISWGIIYLYLFLEIITANYISLNLSVERKFFK